jgi:hypothetical protein
MVGFRLFINSLPQRRRDAENGNEMVLAPVSLVDLARMDFLACTGDIIDSGLCVHRHLGPGLLENPYHTCLVFELRFTQSMKRSSCHISGPRD